jgi:uncharacterized membrane protein
MSAGDGRCFPDWLGLAHKALRSVSDTDGVTGREGDGGLQTTRLADMMDALAILIAVGLLAVVYEGDAGLARVLLALAFAFFVPGRAVVSNWRQLDRWSTATMSMVLSLSILALISTVALWMHWWHPVGLFQVLAVLSVVSLTVGCARRRSRRARQGASDVEMTGHPYREPTREGFEEQSTADPVTRRADRRRRADY